MQIFCYLCVTFGAFLYFLCPFLFFFGTYFVRLIPLYIIRTHVCHLVCFIVFHSGNMFRKNCLHSLMRQRIWGGLCVFYDNRSAIQKEVHSFFLIGIVNIFLNHNTVHWVGIQVYIAKSFWFMFINLKISFKSSKWIKNAW